MTKKKLTTFDVDDFDDMESTQPPLCLTRNGCVIEESTQKQMQQEPLLDITNCNYHVHNKSSGAHYV